MAVGLVVALAARGGDSPAEESTVTGTEPTATVSRATATPVALATPGGLETPPPQRPAGEVSGFAFPIPGGCLPQSPLLMPGASREYRKGIHEGVDFFDSDNCTAIGLGSEVVAVAAGTVLRADRGYEELTPVTAAALRDELERNGSSDPGTLDRLRGRQVWIDHGGGVVTRYAHLSAIADGIEAGGRVERGRLLAYVGESGTVDSIEAPGSQFHLHFEIRIGASYLGAGEGAAATRTLYERAFSQ
ncbi:MAG: M23 family metallopeptidase [Chloroflexi bacterium]|nr:M23 family metallopeptidase [Chloroflexota bacterium]